MFMSEQYFSKRTQAMELYLEPYLGTRVRTCMIRTPDPSSASTGVHLYHAHKSFHLVVICRHFTFCAIRFCWSLTMQASVTNVEDKAPYAYTGIKPYAQCRPYAQYECRDLCLLAIMWKSEATVSWWENFFHIPRMYAAHVARSSATVENHCFLAICVCARRHCRRPIVHKGCDNRAVYKHT